MKSFSSTFIFGILVALIAVFAYWELRQSDEEKSVEAEKAKLLPYWSQEDIVNVVFSNNGKNLTLNYENTMWNISSPVSDQADSSSVASLLSAIISDEVIKLDSDSEVNWAQFGLDQTERYVEFKSKDSRVEKIFVSTKKSFDGKFYLKYEGKADLYLGSSTWENWLNRSANDLRNKKLLRLQDKIIGLKIAPTSKKELSFVLNFVLNNDTWTLSTEPDFVLDQEKVKSLVSSLQNFRAADVVSESRDPVALKKFGLTNPDLKQELNLESGENKTLYISKIKNSGEDVFLYVEDKPYIYKTTKSVVEKWNVSKEAYKMKEEDPKDKSNIENKPSEDSHQGHDH